MSTLALMLTLTIAIAIAIVRMQGVTGAYIQNRGCVQ